MLYLPSLELFWIEGLISVKTDNQFLVLYLHCIGT